MAFVLLARRRTWLRPRFTIMPGPSFTISRNGTKKPVGRPKPTSLQSPLAHFPPRCTPELTVHLTPRAARRHCDCETSEQRSMVLTGRSAGRFMVMDTRCVACTGQTSSMALASFWVLAVPFLLWPCRTIKGLLETKGKTWQSQPSPSVSAWAS